MPTNSLAVPIPSSLRYFRGTGPIGVSWNTNVVIRYRAYHHCPYEAGTPIIPLGQIRTKSVHINIVSLGVNGDVIADLAVLGVVHVLLDHNVGLVWH